MSWYYYSDAAEQKERTRQEIALRVKRGQTFESFDAPKGSSKLVKSFWAKEWCRHLESYSGYEYRMPRGRSYLRQGNVYNFKAGPGKMTATVAGSSLYEVEVQINPLPTAKWKAIRRQCEGQVASLLDLLSGKLGDGVMKIISDPVAGLFPSPREIQHSCTCLDYADLCKHRAAVLYAAGVLFDRDPKIFFELRGVDPSDLIASSAASLASSPGKSGGSAGQAGNDLSSDDLSALFGIDLDDTASGSPAPTPGKTTAKAKSPASRPVKSTGKAKAKAKSTSKAKTKTAAKAAAPAKTKAKSQTQAPAKATGNVKAKAKAKAQAEAEAPAKPESPVQAKTTSWAPKALTMADLRKLVPEAKTKSKKKTASRTKAKVKPVIPMWIISGRISKDILEVKSAPEPAPAKKATSRPSAKKAKGKR